MPYGKLDETLSPVTVSPACVAASAKGYYLKWWRYGRNTEALVQQALARETWSEEQWERGSKNVYHTYFHRAANHVPYYRDMWSKRRQKGKFFVGASWRIGLS